VQLGFTDNVVVNGVGNDLAIFELGIPDQFAVSLTIDGVSHIYSSVDTGYLVGTTASNTKLAVALVNLDDFGLSAGEIIDSVVLGMDIRTNGHVPTLAAVGALSHADATCVPEPVSLAIWSLLGGCCLVFAWRKRKPA
jgi:hypothetical protein